MLKKRPAGDEKDQASITRVKVLSCHLAAAYAFYRVAELMRDKLGTDWRSVGRVLVPAVVTYICFSQIGPLIIYIGNRKKARAAAAGR